MSALYGTHIAQEEARRERALEFVLQGRQGPWNSGKMVEEAKIIEAYLKGEEESGSNESSDGN